MLIPQDQAAKALELLLDLVLSPALLDQPFSMERDVVLEEIAQYQDQPDEQVWQQLLSRACGDHPYGRPILGDPNSLRAMQPADMRRFHSSRYRGETAVSPSAAREPRHCGHGSRPQLWPPCPMRREPSPTPQ